MPWPQLPSGKDIADGFAMFGKLILTLACLAILGMVGNLIYVLHQEKETGVSRHERYAREHAEKLDEEIHRLQNERARTLKKYDGANK